MIGATLCSGIGAPECAAPWVDWRGKPAADGPRYKALGNSMAVPVMSYLLERVRVIDEAEKQRAPSADADEAREVVERGDAV